MMKKWYEQTWASILLLIFFFPVGLYLMWKYTNWNKFIKGGISILIVIAFIGGIVGGGKDNAPSVSPATTSNSASSQSDNDSEASKESTTSDKPKEELKKDDPEFLKTVALTVDSQIYVTVLNSEEITKLLQEGIALFSDGQGNTLELYDLVKAAKETQSTVYSNLSRLRDDDNKAYKEYIEAAKMYVSNNVTLADKLMKYIEKGEIKYLSDAEDCLESYKSYLTSVVSARRAYLSDQGLTDEEISTLLTSDFSSKSE